MTKKKYGTKKGKTGQTNKTGTHASQKPSLINPSHEVDAPLRFGTIQKFELPFPLPMVHDDQMDSFELHELHNSGSNFYF